MENALYMFHRFLRYFRSSVIGTILLYHRVADVTDDPHQLSVSKLNFQKHVEWLTHNTRVVPLATLVHNLMHNIVSPRLVSITFDDGYADNYRNALPILRAHNAPATFFVTTGKIGDTKPFYWDLMTRQKDQGRPLTKKELMRLSTHPLVEIGSHSMSHRRFSAISAADKKKEIARSKKLLDGMVGKAMKGFSYPFGTTRDYDSDTIDIVRSSGYQYACANFAGSVTRFSHPYALPRNIIRNWPKDVFIQKMERLL